MDWQQEDALEAGQKNAVASGLTTGRRRRKGLTPSAGRRALRLYSTCSVPPAECEEYSGA